MDEQKMNLRIRIDSELKSKLEKVCRRKLSSQQDVIDRLVTWFVDLDETLQSLILGQIGPRDQAVVLEMVLQRLLDDSAPEQAQPAVKGRTTGGGVIAKKRKS
jgi:hypothetical protein